MVQQGSTYAIFAKVKPVSALQYLITVCNSVKILTLVHPKFHISTQLLYVTLFNLPLRYTYAIISRVEYCVPNHLQDFFLTFLVGHLASACESMQRPLLPG